MNKYGWSWKKTKKPTGTRMSARTLGLTDDKILEGIQLQVEIL